VAFFSPSEPDIIPSRESCCGIDTFHPNRVAPQPSRQPKPPERHYSGVPPRLGRFSPPPCPLSGTPRDAPIQLKCPITLLALQNSPPRELSSNPSDSFFKILSKTSANHLNGQDVLPPLPEAFPPFFVIGLASSPHGPIGSQKHSHRPIPSL